MNNNSIRYQIPDMTVNYDEKPCYKITFQGSFHNLRDYLKQLGYNSSVKICIITDTNVSPLYLDDVIDNLQGYFHTITSFTFQAGEEQKNLDTISEIYNKLITEHFDRKDLMLALGGGVTGDMCGFAASTYLRGIDFIQIPTTLLAQVDSSIGGKTGVDFRQYKNMVGAFYQPKLVYINLNVLKTLPDDHFYAGMGEVVKHGLIRDREYFDWLCSNAPAIMERRIDVMGEMIQRSCNIKRRVVENDPKEKGERALLNFGHTIGHAVEKLSDFRLIHGYCVALGIIAACSISERRGMISTQDFLRIRESFRLFHLPEKIPFSMNDQDIIDVTKLDKKMEAGKIKFILLDSVGCACIRKNVSEKEMLDAIRILND